MRPWYRGYTRLSLDDGEFSCAPISPAPAQGSDSAPWLRVISPKGVMSRADMGFRIIYTSRVAGILFPLSGIAIRERRSGTMGRQLQSNPVTCSLCPVHSRHSPHRLARDQPGLQDRTADRQHRLESRVQMEQ